MLRNNASWGHSVATVGITVAVGSTRNDDTDINAIANIRRSEPPIIGIAIGYLDLDPVLISSTTSRAKITIGTVVLPWCTLVRVIITTSIHFRS